MKSRHYPIHSAARAEIGNETATLVYAIRRLRSATALGALWLALTFALWPSSLEAGCAQWEVSGGYNLKQSDGNLVHVLLKQGTFSPNGTGSVWGTASYSDKNVGRREGDVEGTVQGSNFNVRVVWKDNKDVGYWRGTILPSGIIQGSCSSEQVRSYKATFVSDKPMFCVPPPTPKIPLARENPPVIRAGQFVILKCLMPAYFDLGPRYNPSIKEDVLLNGTRYQVKDNNGREVTIKTPNGKHFKEYEVPLECVEIAPPASPKVVFHTGKEKNQAPTDASSSGDRTSSKDAGIIAAPTMVNIRAGYTEGSTQIYWNAGPAHPDAEVWVKVGDEDKKRLFKKGKGSTAMGVRRGRNVFSLTDAGEELATVTVTGK